MRAPLPQDSPPAPASADNRRAWGWALIVLGAAVLIRVVFGVVLPPFPDEAYYLAWSRRLAAGYFDHPPAIAFLVAAGTALIGPSAIGIRIGGIVAGGLASLAVIVLARRIGGDPAALRASIVLACMPWSVLLLVTTPDPPFFMMAALTFLAVDRALASRAGTATETAWWGAAGVAGGLGLMTKLTSALVPIAIGVALLTRSDLRRRLNGPGPWLAVVAAGILFSPFLVWASAHDWIPFTFQFAHGLGDGEGSAIAQELDLFGGQMVLVSPILLVLMAVAVLRGLRDPDPRRALLAIATVVFAGVFVVSALRKPVHPNWPAVMCIPGTVVLATAFRGNRGRTWFRRGVVLAGALIGAIYLEAAIPWMPLSTEDDPIAVAYGWDQQADAIGEAIAAAEQSGCPRAWPGARTYETASEISFYLTDNPTVFVISAIQSRPSQYDLWPSFAALAEPGDCLILSGGTEVTRRGLPALRNSFESMTLHRTGVRDQRGGSIGTYDVWVLRGWSGNPDPFEENR
jgi:hypothetical protein